MVFRYRQKRQVVHIQNTLLGLLEAEPRHGYDLKRIYDRLFQELRPLRFGQLYSTLARSQRDGLVTIGDPEPGLGPDRRSYTLTATGSATVATWLQQTEPVTGPVESSLFPKVVLSLLTQRPTRDLLEAQRAVHLDRMRTLLRSREDQHDEAALALVELQAFHVEADIRWLDHTLERLDLIRRTLDR